ncbi:MAG TPA: GNAT family N-acetyltransferase [Gemmatimonadaceae bacterium]|jgi:ribosomal protein S18 acetylase RimI-like enzyme
MKRRGETGRDDGTAASAAGVTQSLGRTRAVTVRQSATRPTIAVRRATFADLPVIVELRLALLRENGNHPVYGRLRADARERAYEVFGAQLRSPHEVMLLAEANREVAGILRCVETFNSPLLHPDRYCYISSVYVRPRRRRAGVLKALVHCAEVWCAERGLTEMRLHNVPGGGASSAWAASGFTVVEEVRQKVLSG